MEKDNAIDNSEARVMHNVPFTSLNMQTERNELIKHNFPQQLTLLEQRV